MPLRSRRSRSLRARVARGFTLLEIVVTLSVLAMTAGLVTVAVNRVGDDAPRDVTLVSLDRVRAAIMQGFYIDQRALPERLEQLIVNENDEFAEYDPARRFGWRGPYLTSHSGRFIATTTTDPDSLLDASFDPYGTVGDLTPFDGWGRPIVIQRPDEDGNGNVDATESRYSRLVSAGADGEIATPQNVRFPTLIECGDDLVLYLRVADERE